jgi:cyclohexa-1,5-dienecarbonyl-CoA hydratase
VSAPTTGTLQQPHVPGPAGGYRALRLQRRAGIVTLTLARPPLNVLDLATLAELDHALAALSDERPLKALLLVGAADAFCAGVDVTDHLADQVASTLGLFHRVVNRLLAMECPTVAAVHGATLGGGCELMLACDLAVAREDARIGQPEIQLGVFPPVAAALLPSLVGRQRAMDLVLTGRTLGAVEAREMGLVSAVVPAAEWETGVARFVGRLERLSGPVLRLAKRAVVESPARGGPAEAIAAAEELYLAELMRLEDAEEGLRSFIEKRRPVWKEG